MQDARSAVHDAEFRVFNSNLESRNSQLSHYTLCFSIMATNYWALLPLVLAWEAAN